MGGHIVCAHKDNNKKKTLKRVIVYKNCLKCNSQFKVVRTLNFDGTQNIRKSENEYCSAFCGKSRTLSKETKKKISISLMGHPAHNNYFRLPEKYCSSCSKKIKFHSKTGMCFNCLCKTGGFKAINSYQRKKYNRSKNEKYFSELCKKRFDYVFENIKMFDGWDADIILIDQKVAILWNGVIHYKDIYHNGSLVKIQERDKLKLEAIKKHKFETYIIKDTGKEDNKFVEEEFSKLLNYTNTTQGRLVV
jgi:hypothetical protein